MNKTAARLLRWGVVLGLLIALPAFALREKWSDFAALWFERGVRAEDTPSGGLAQSIMHIGDANPQLAQSFQSPQRSDHLQSKQVRSSTDNRTQPRGAPQLVWVRDLRTCVYRPLSSGDDQNIQRIPATSSRAENGIIR